MSSESKGAYVRAPLPHEFPEISRVQCRAFSDDPLMNWLGSVQARIELPPRTSIASYTERNMPKELLILYYFQHSLTLATRIVGGRVMVVVVPENEGKERIVSVALWIPPGKKVDSPMVILRSRQHRTMFGSWRRPGGWGFTGFQRAAIAFQPLIDKLQEKACKSKSLSFHDCWHLQGVTTDPDEEGKGYCKLLMNEGITFIGSAPICLEATTPKTREIYLRYGFEITGSPIFGAEKVGKNGIPVLANEEATGISIWTMMKVP